MATENGTAPSTTAPSFERWIEDTHSGMLVPESRLYLDRENNLRDVALIDDISRDEWLEDWVTRGEDDPPGPDTESL